MDGAELLNDPEMKEVVDDFCKESEDLFEQLEDVLEDLEDDPSDSAKLEQFGQTIDRVMGAAKSIGLEEIATFSELGKTIGYKSSQVEDMPLREVVIAILFDALDLLKKMVAALKKGNIEGMKDLNTKAFATRMKWLSDKFKNVERGSCEYDSEEKQSQDEIDNLMESLGL